MKIYRIFQKSSKENHWKGFSDNDNFTLKDCLHSKILLRENDIELAQNLWKSYQNNDLTSLKQLAQNESNSFHFLKEVIDSFIDINPENFIKNQIEKGLPNFDSVFKKFQEELGVFGFGDLQVKKIYENILRQSKA